MTSRSILLRALLLAAPALGIASAAHAHPPMGGGMGWNGPGLNEPGWGMDSRMDRDMDRREGARRDRSNEGRVIVERFVAEGDAAQALGHGRIAVSAAAGTDTEARDTATFEAAVVDQLVRTGYDVATPEPTGGQVVEITVTRDVVQPEEAARKPLSGSMEVGVSNRGSMVGMALAYDATKPLKALVATRLEARIRDRATGKALWEGRATIQTREGDDHWTQGAVATKLAASLFDHFPAAGGSDFAER